MATTVGNFSLTNTGGFVARIYFQYTEPNGHGYRSSNGPDIDIDQTKSSTPGSLGVPNGSTVYFNVDVVWGDDNSYSAPFIYDQSSTATANFTISGTTLNNSLSFTGITG